MTSKVAIERIKQGLEKQDTSFDANFSRDDMEDALNKSLTLWFRRQDWGTNQRKEGEESSEMVTDDLQLFLTEKKMSVTNYDIYADSINLPEDYRYMNRVSVYASKGDCKKILIPSTLIENSNVDVYLQNWSTSPSFDFEQCFHVLLSNKIRIFTNQDFKVDSIKLSFFRSPQKISCEIKDLDKIWELKEDVAELIIDEAIQFLASTTQNMAAYQTTEKRTIINN